MDELKTLNKVGKSFNPKMNNAKKEKLYKGWKKAVTATQVFAEDEDEQEVIVYDSRKKAE